MWSCLFLLRLLFTKLSIIIEEGETSLLFKKERSAYNRNQYAYF